jgi:hypothetical protein
MPRASPSGDFPGASALLVVLGAGVLLAWGGARLQRTFVEERESADAAIVSRQRALAQYALVALERRLKAALERGRTKIDAALADPLSDAQGLLLIEDGEQRLPRLGRYLAAAGTPASQLRAELVGGAVRETPDGLWGERLSLLDAFRRALVAGDSEAVTLAVRDLLNHESRHVIEVTR